jgi:hypothetical protein
MARVAGDDAFARKCRGLFESGSKWIDANLFNRQYYIQQIRPYRNNQIAPSLRSNMGAEDPEHPEYQVGQGCLVDQLVGQCLAEVSGLGLLLDPGHVRTALETIYRLNHKASLYTHDCVQRTFALNDESALVVCDYGATKRPRIPFPYFAEVFTGLEYSTAAHMIYAGMLREGVECIADIRARYDGERRNPWDEAECGHQYARAMAAWSGLLALSGFRYHGGEQSVIIRPPQASSSNFQCFWSTAAGWGVFSHDRRGTRIRVDHGQLVMRRCNLTHGGLPVTRAGVVLPAKVQQFEGLPWITFDNPVTVSEGEELFFHV